MRRHSNTAPVIAASLYKGKAIGGPRDGVKLEASLSWDGKVRKLTREGETTNSFYPGYYKWTNPDFDSPKTWVWQSTETPPKVGHPQPIRKYRTGFHR